MQNGLDSFNGCGYQAHLLAPEKHRAVTQAGIETIMADLPLVLTQD
jgi:hypothetical protein